MSIFDNVQLEDCFILEGEQAKAYKAKKDEDYEKRREENKKYEERARNKDIGNTNKPGTAKKAEDIQRGRTANRAAHHMMHSGDNKETKSYTDYLSAKDATNRHMRRHSKKVSEALDMLAAIEYDYNG